MNKTASATEFLANHRELVIGEVGNAFGNLPSLTDGGVVRSEAIMFAGPEGWDEVKVEVVVDKPKVIVAEPGDKGWKKTAAIALWKEHGGKAYGGRKAWINLLMVECGLSQQGASTYYYNIGSPNGPWFAQANF